MSTTPDEALRKYLWKHAITVQAAQTALDTLAPFEAIGKKHGYPLRPASSLNVGDLASAMWTAFKFPLHRCWFLHAKTPLEEKPWTTEATRLDDLVVHAYADNCKRSFIYDTAFERAFAETVGNRLTAALDVTLAKTGLLARGLHPSQMLLAVLRMRIALCASGSPEVHKLNPLASILPYAIPMAGNVGKHGEWCVVVQ